MVLHLEQIYTDFVMVFGKEEEDMNMQIHGLEKTQEIVKELQHLSQNIID